MTVHATLTRRQQQVMELMCQGLPTRLIAKQLHLSCNTVKEHRGMVLKLMGVENTVALVLKLQQLGGLIRSPDLEAALARPPYVIVVEDDHPYREMVLSGLKLAGFSGQGTADSQGMRAALAEQKADVVVLDLNLGEEDGLDIARDLRKTHPHVGIVMMTVRGVVDQRIDGLVVGADAYLIKPVDIRELIQVTLNLHRRLVEGRFAAALA